MNDGLTILVVGGYGTFGGRIVELLEDEPRLTMIVAGRSLERAGTYCQGRTNAKARLVPAAFDRDGDIAAQLVAHRPDMLVDASGPFQSYGARKYRVVEACVSNSVNYLDLADGSEFVEGIRILDSVARAVGVYVLSGVSSFPVLTAAVVRRLSVDMTRINLIRGGIAPSPFAGVGENVVRAIATYAGQPVELRRDAEIRIGRPFTEQMRFTIAPPGHIPLRSTLFSLVDVPDLRALADQWAHARTIWMGAGPVPEPLHRALIALAWLVRLKMVRSLLPLARLMHFASNHLRWGEHRGGMFVEVEGSTGLGTYMRRSWHLLAEGDDGPFIPAMAIAAIVRKVLAGDAPRTGARAAVRELTLDDYEALFAGRTIYTSIMETPAADLPLYRRVLGEAWHAVPREVQTMHDNRGTAHAEGVANIVRGQGLLARLVASFFRFPETGAAVSVAVRFDVADGVETWTRTFAGKPMVSRQYAGDGRSDRLLCERFGPFTFAMALLPDGDRLRLVLRRWSFLGLPLPMWLCPRSDSYETGKDGRFYFNVEIGHRLTGPIVRYRGWLVRSS